MKDEESLKGVGRLCHLADLVEGMLDLLLADGVVPSRVVVGRVLLAGQQVALVEQFVVGAVLDLVDDRGLQVDEEGPRRKVAGSGLQEEGLKGLIAVVNILNCKKYFR